MLNVASPLHFSSQFIFLASHSQAPSTQKHPPPLPPITNRHPPNLKPSTMAVINVHDEDGHHDQHRQPLLSPPADDERTSLVQKAIRQTFKSTADLANHLPTGTVLAFQLLSPICTNLGHCDSASRVMTACLIAICGLSSFVLSFSDSFKDGSGTVRYGLATLKGLWVIDGTALPPEAAAGYKLKFVDFVHALVSVLVFAAVTLFDQNVVSCFYPVPSPEMEEVLTALPVAIGILGSGVFVTYPTTRHGIGFPLTN